MRLAHVSKEQGELQPKSLDSSYSPPVDVDPPVWPQQRYTMSSSTLAPTAPKSEKRQVSPVDKHHPAEWFLNQVGLRPPQPIPRLTEQPHQDFGASLSSNQDAARSLLVRQRISAPGYQAPAQQKRRLFWTKAQREAASEEANWTFTKHEVAKALDAILGHDPTKSDEPLFFEPQPSPGVVQALLSHAPSSPLDELWCHLQDPELENRPEKGIKSEKGDPCFDSVSPSDMTWLKWATTHRNLEYLRVLCRARASPGTENALTQAFGVALSEYSTRAMTILLGSGAKASPYQSTIRKHINKGDIALVKLLLSAPDSMDTAAWLESLRTDVTSPEPIPISHHILLDCVTHRRDLACPSLLVEQLAIQNVENTAILLAYADSSDVFFSVQEQACELASGVRDAERRLAFFTLLDGSGLVIDGPKVREQLMRSLEGRLVPLAQVLIRAGVKVDVSPHNSLEWAVSRLDIPALQLLKDGALIGSVSNALMHIPESASETDLVQILKILGPRGVTGKHLDSLLQGAVRGEMRELAKTLVQYGASVESNQAAAIKFAVERGDLDMLGILFQSACSPEVMSTTIPAVMQVIFESTGNAEYKLLLDILALLLQKSASGPPMDHALLDAVSKDAYLGIVRLLVEHGADANYASGASFAFAIESRNLELLETLCAGCSPNQANFPLLVNMSIDPRYYSLSTLALLLGTSHSPGMLDDLWRNTSVESLHKNCPNPNEVIPCFLRHGLNVDVEDGILLRLAVRAQNITLLEMVLSANPSTTTLTNAFRDATCLESRSVRLEILKIILTAAVPHEIGQADMFPAETHAALGGDMAGLQLLLRFEASLGSDSGDALSIAAKSGSSQVLRMLLSTSHTVVGVERALIATASAPLTAVAKFGIIQQLCADSETLSVTCLCQALSLCLELHPDLPDLPRLLLRCGAKLDSDLLEMALERSPRSVFGDLVSAVDSPFLAGKVLRHARKTALKAEKRHWVYKILLGKIVHHKDASETLIHSVKTDPTNLDIPELLLTHGAQVGHNNGEALTIVSSPIKSNLLRLLSRHLNNKTDDEVANRTFYVASNNPVLHGPLRLEIYHNLHSCKITGESLYHALVAELREKHCDIPTVQFLLSHGVDTNKEKCYCFALAVISNHEEAFRLLARHAAFESSHDSDQSSSGQKQIATAAVVFERLLSPIAQESVVAKWFRIFLSEQASGSKPELGELLFECMSKFPNSTELLQVLLDHGVPASSKIWCELQEPRESEQCTALIWALSRRPRIADNVIMCLLACGIEARPAYITSQRGLCAVFLCLLEERTASVLKPLLALLDAEDTTVSGSTFIDLATYPNKPEEEGLTALFDNDDQISLREAALYLGNLGAFRLVGGDSPDDGSLHFAALLGLSHFALWLLENGHDANHESEAFDFMTPLALACSSKPFPWCKVANGMWPWATRLQLTMSALIRVSKLHWRHRGKLVLYIALDNGVETATAMIRALDKGFTRSGWLNRDYCYKDKTGKEYTPREYVNAFVGDEEGERSALLEVLKEHKVN